MKNKIRKKLKNKGIYAYRVGRDDFFTYWTRPKKAENVKVIPSSVADIAIVVQGPIKYEDDFTYESMKLYRKQYPDCKVILSTWDNEDTELLKKIEELGVSVCISKLPGKRTGMDPSVNLQRKNTRRGIEEAISFGCKYIAKLRTDQRIYSQNALDFCKKLIIDFPIETAHIQAEGRIISTSTGTFANRFYNVSDLFLFGYASDLLRYFSCPEDIRERWSGRYPEDMFEFSQLRVGEIYFASYYIESLGYELKWTKEDSDWYMSKLFIIIDAESIDLYWPKYTDEEYRWRSYTGDKGLKQVTFSDWYLMQAEMD